MQGVSDGACSRRFQCKACITECLLTLLLTYAGAMQGVGARAREQASEVVRQNEQRLQSAFGLLSLLLAMLGSALLFVPDKARPSGQYPCSR